MREKMKICRTLSHAYACFQTQRCGFGSTLGPFIKLFVIILFFNFCVFIIIFLFCFLFVCLFFGGSWSSLSISFLFCVVYKTNHQHQSWHQSKHNLDDAKHHIFFPASQPTIFCIKLGSRHLVQSQIMSTQLTFFLFSFAFSFDTRERCKKVLFQAIH